MKTQHVTSRSKFASSAPYLVTALFSVITNLIPAAYGSPGGPVTVGSLVEENFSLWRESTWNVDRSGGTWSRIANSEFYIRDTSTVDAFSMWRSFVTQTSGELVMEFRFEQRTNTGNSTSTMPGTEWKLRSGTTVALNIITTNVTISGAPTGDKICYQNSSGNYVYLQQYSASQNYGVKAVVNLTTQTATIYVDGIVRATNVAFANTVSNLDNVYVKTGLASKGDLYLAPLLVHKGYTIREKFLATKLGALVDTASGGEWGVDTTGGTATVEDNNGANKPDTRGVTLDDTSTTGLVSLTKTFASQSAAQVFDYSFLLPVKMDGVGVDLRNGASIAARLITQSGDLVWQKTGSTDTVISNYRANLWYRIRIVADPATDLADVYVNERRILQGVAFNTAVPAIDRMHAFTSVSRQGAVKFDDFTLHTKVAEPVDYVSTPNAITPNVPYVGMQTFSGWREGYHYGWDSINSYPDREPVLGFYDEGSTEVADWDIKWMVEHGINFQMFCWFRPATYQGNPTTGKPESRMPIKDPGLGHGIKAFLNAKYSSLMKFTIMWENNVLDYTSNSTDFRQHVVPFWIEHYFKDPRYLVIGNKPVIFINNWDRLRCDYGSVAGGKAELDYLRAECVAAGFSGAIILVENHFASSANLQICKDLGLDYVFTYNWGYSAWYGNAQKDTLIAQQSANKIPAVATLSMGRDDSAWKTQVTPGNYLSSTDFQTLATWVKNTYMPAEATAGNLGGSMVLFDNWNEFGEGHFIAPTTRLGFSYLDRIRATFTAGGAHTDTVPTQAQWDRVNTLYPSDRATPVSNDRLWRFNNSGNNTEGWIANGHVASITVTDTSSTFPGTLNATSTGNDPVLFSADDLNVPIDIPAVAAMPLTHFRIRFKNGTSATSAQMFFITASDPTWNATKSVTFTITANDPNYTEYVVNMSSVSGWTGTLKQIRVDPSYTTGTFNIDEISLLSDQAAPQFSLQPTFSPIRSGYFATNATVTISATTASIASVTYQWYKVKGGVTTLITGATSDTLTLTNVSQSTDEANYYVVATSARGSTQSNSALLQVNRTIPAPVCPPN